MLIAIKFKLKMKPTGQPSEEDDDELLIIETCSTSTSSASSSLSPSPVATHHHHTVLFNRDKDKKLPSKNKSFLMKPPPSTDVPPSSPASENLHQLMDHFNCRRQSRRGVRSKSICLKVDAARPLPIRLYFKLVKVSSAPLSFTNIFCIEICSIV